MFVDVRQPVHQISFPSLLYVATYLQALSWQRTTFVPASGYVEVIVFVLLHNGHGSPFGAFSSSGFVSAAP
jgi:hypothetical protein